MTTVGNASLAYLTDAVIAQLGDAASLTGPELVERFLNEGLRKLEPEHLKEKAASLIWADGATSFALPSDLYEITAIRPDTDSSVMPQGWKRHGATLYFDPRFTVSAFTGTIFYRAHYPLIDATTPSELPPAANDALISYALYKSIARIATNRAEYRRYATLTQNGVTVGDLMSLANSHLADFNDAKAASMRVAPPSFYED